MYRVWSSYVLVKTVDKVERAAGGKYYFENSVVKRWTTKSCVEVNELERMRNLRFSSAQFTQPVGVAPLVR